MSKCLLSSRTSRRRPSILCGFEGENFNQTKTDTAVHYIKTGVDPTNTVINSVTRTAVHLRHIGQRTLGFFYYVFAINITTVLVWRILLLPWGWGIVIGTNLGFT